MRGRRALQPSLVRSLSDWSITDLVPSRVQSWKLRLTPRAGVVCLRGSIRSGSEQKKTHHAAYGFGFSEMMYSVISSICSGLSIRFGILA